MQAASKRGEITQFCSKLETKGLGLVSSITTNKGIGFFSKTSEIP
jgi:hypothetical protein